MFIAFALIVPSLAKISLVFVFSHLTPVDLKDQVLNVLDSGILDDFQVQIHNSNGYESPQITADFFVNFSESVVITTQLQALACQQSSILLQPSAPPDSYVYSTCLYYTHPPISEHSQALFQLTKSLGWTSTFLTASGTFESQKLVSHLYSRLLRVNAFAEVYDILSNESDQNLFNRYVTKKIKPSGNWKIVTLNEPEGAQNCLLYTSDAADE